MTLCPKCHAILPTHNPWCPDVQPPPVPEPLAMQARDLLVRNRELEATVARVRGLVEWNKRMAGRYQANGTVIANDLTQALDGEPQP